MVRTNSEIIVITRLKVESKHVERYIVWIEANERKIDVKRGSECVERIKGRKRRENVIRCQQNAIKREPRSKCI